MEKIKENLIEDLKKEWRSLWRERIDDRVRAEAIANKDYERLFVEKGTIIFATKNFKMPTFREILQMHGLVDVERFVPPSPAVGGWGKFIRTFIASQFPSKRVKRAQAYSFEEKVKQQPKKGGRGWLHLV
jgi:hypothetical protein